MQCGQGQSRVARGRGRVSVRVLTVLNSGVVESGMWLLEHVCFPDQLVARIIARAAKLKEKINNTLNYCRPLKLISCLAVRSRHSTTKPAVSSQHLGSVSSRRGGRRKNAANTKKFQSAPES
jgi:hypothetical protein